MRLLSRLLSLRKLPLHLLFFSPPKTSSPNSWRCSWRQYRPRLGTENYWSHENVYSRLGPWIPIPENHTWTATIFVSSVKIILKHQVPQEWIVSHLPPPSSAAPSASNRPNISTATRAPLQSRGQSLKSSSKRTSETPRPLLITFGISLEETLNINWKRLEITPLIFNTSS